MYILLTHWYGQELIPSPFYRSKAERSQGHAGARRQIQELKFRLQIYVLALKCGLEILALAWYSLIHGIFLWYQILPALSLVCTLMLEGIPLLQRHPAWEVVCLSSMLEMSILYQTA